MEGIQNNKSYISETNFYTRVRFISSDRNTMRQLVTFGGLSNDVETTGAGSMRVVASRVAVPYGCPASS
jgi:hypothetical protein